MTKRAIPSLSDEEEAVIQTQIAADPDDSDATDAELADARPFAEVLPDLMASIRRGRGRPVLERPREKVTIRLEADVVAKFRATGKGWQSRINDVLRKSEVG